MKRKRGEQQQRLELHDKLGDGEETGVVSLRGGNRI